MLGGDEPVYRAVAPVLECYARNGDFGEGARARDAQEEREDDERHGHDDPAPEDVVHESVRVLDLREGRAAQGGEAPLDGDEGGPRPDHGTTATPNARSPMRMPRTMKIGRASCRERV